MALCITKPFLETFYDIRLVTNPIDCNPPKCFMNKCTEISWPAFWSTSNRSTHITLSLFEDCALTFVGNRLSWCSWEPSTCTKLVLFNIWLFWEGKFINHVFSCHLKDNTAMSKLHSCMPNINFSYKRGFLHNRKLRGGVGSIQRSLLRFCSAKNFVPEKAYPFVIERYFHFFINLQCDRKQRVWWRRIVLRIYENAVPGLISAF